MDDYYSDDDMDEVSPQNPPKTVIMQEYGDRFNNAVSYIAALLCNFIKFTNKLLSLFFQIKYINSQRVVGLSCEGIHVGRYGKVCWLVVSVFIQEDKDGVAVAHGFSLLFPGLPSMEALVA